MGTNEKSINNENMLNIKDGWDTSKIKINTTFMSVIMSVCIYSILCFIIILLIYFIVYSSTTG